MALIKSISGTRGTIGGLAGKNLTPQDIVEVSSAYAQWLLDHNRGKKPKVILGRDARISGHLVSQLVRASLQMTGVDVVDLGLTTTPTVEMAVMQQQADGGIILTASHNPREWNALKLLNGKGEFLSATDGESLLATIKEGNVNYALIDDLGTYTQMETALEQHIEAILAHDLVDAKAVQEKGYKVVVDAVNSTGALAMPPLLAALGCECILLHGEPNGEFAHNPEPLPQHLCDLIDKVKTTGADLGVAVDPDVDRLALVGKGGSWIGEEYTLVLVADYILQHRKGPTVSNLSSSRALRDLTKSYGQTYHAAKVGEVNVVEKMKAVGAVIGGEGNGGIIVPDLHYGRDALAGLALVLTYLAKSGKELHELRAGYAEYVMIKTKLQLAEGMDVDQRLTALAQLHKDQQLDTSDGLKIDFPEGWVQMRKSNTEPIIRIYAEAPSQEKAEEFAALLKDDFLKL